MEAPDNVEQGQLSTGRKRRDSSIRHVVALADVELGQLSTSGRELLDPSVRDIPTTSQRDGHRLREPSDDGSERGVRQALRPCAGEVNIRRDTCACFAPLLGHVRHHAHQKLAVLDERKYVPEQLARQLRWPYPVGWAFSD